ncbi:hypothetical protein ACTMTJ_38230 [Phytohabitans sp. LJ34]|uniref:hypothetical protein n=1 Tax=Phytohabitans sp. LJ34 TaxID=3452217 RepID=UPI003F890B25
MARSGPWSAPTYVSHPEATMGDRVAHLIVSRAIDLIEFDDEYAIGKIRRRRGRAHPGGLGPAHPLRRHVIGVRQWPALSTFDQVERFTAVT